MENYVGPVEEGYVLWQDEIEVPKTSLQFRYETNEHLGSAILRRMYLTLETYCIAQEGVGSEEELAGRAADDTLYETRLGIEDFFANNRSNVHNISITEVDNQDDVEPPYALVRTDIEILYERPDSD